MSHFHFLSTQYCLSTKVTNWNVINKPDKQNHNCCLGQSEYLLQNNEITGQIWILFPFFFFFFFSGKSGCSWRCFLHMRDCGVFLLVSGISSTLPFPVFFLIKRYSGLMELNCLPVFFTGRLTLGGVHGEAEVTST